MIYSPEEDSYLLEEQVLKYSKGKSVLDIGSGSGIQALAALKSKAKSVLATDIDEESINYLRSLNKNKLEIIKSNLFSKIKGKFDLIIFNPPYLPQNAKEDKESAKATTGGKKGDEIILRFLKQAKSHLNKEGIILLLLSSLTPKNRIEKILLSSKLKYTIISEKRLFFESLDVLKIELLL